MNLKYSQIQIVVTSSKYCVKSRNESCVPFLSNCNTFIQSLQLSLCSDGRFGLWGASGKFWSQRRWWLSQRRSKTKPGPVHGHVKAMPKHCFSWYELEGTQLSPYQQPVTRRECGSGRPPPAGTSPLPSLSLQTATIEDPFSRHFLWNCLLSCQAIWIHSATEDSSSEVPVSKGWGRGVGAEQREKGRLSRSIASVGLLWGMLVRPRGCQEALLLGGSASWALAVPTTAARRRLWPGASSPFPSSSLHNSARTLDDERAERDIGVT